MMNKLLSGQVSKYYVLIVFLFIGTALYSPFINNHFAYDDFLFVSLMEENISYNPLTGFWSAELSVSKLFESLWWADKDAEGYFFRPVPTFVISTAYSMWGRNAALPLHIFSIILHCINAFLVYVVLNRLSKSHPVSLLAGFIYLICVHHALNVGWISTNSDLLAVFFMLLSLYCYIMYRETNKNLYLWASLSAQLIAFGCKETASVTTAAIILYEMIIVPVKIESPVKVFFSNSRHWILSFAATIAFLVFYKIEGFGINSFLYYDPFLRPLAFITNLCIGYPLMFLGLLSVLPISFPAFIPELVVPLTIAGIILSVVFLAALIPFRKDRIIVYCFSLFIISVLPQLSADATERQLYFPYTIGSFMISFLIFQIPYFKKRLNSKTPLSPGNGRMGIIGMVFSYYLVISSVLLSFLFMLAYPNSYNKSAIKPEKQTLEIKQLADKKQAEKVILVNTPGPMTLLYMNDIYRFHAGKYIDFYILYGGNGRVWMYKNNDSAVTLKTDAKGWLTSFFAKLPRTDPLIDKQRKYFNKDFSVNIIETTPDKEDILEAQFIFRNSLASSGVIVIYFDGESFRELDINTLKTDEWKFIGDTSDVLKYLK